MSDVQSIVDQINGSPNKDQIISILQQVLAMLQNSVPKVVSSVSDGMAPPVTNSTVSAVMPASMPPQLLASPIGPAPTNTFISREDNPLKWSREAALNVINAETYDRSGNRIPGNANNSNWGKGQRYLNANKTKGAMLKFNGTKYYGGRRRTRR
jgi:hypothetical protein